MTMFGMKLLQFTDHSVENAALSICRYFLQLIVSLKNTGTTILLALTAH
jgi:hypothetical protein